MISKDKMSRLTYLQSISSANVSQMDKEKGFSSEKQEETISSLSTEGAPKNSRSKKINIENEFDISFQEQMLDSHKNRLRSIFISYWSECSKIFPAMTKLPIHKIQNSELIEDQFNSEQFIKAIESCSLLDKQEKLQFIQDFKNEEKLSHLILWVIKINEKQFQSELIFLFSYIWQEYLLNQAKNYVVADLISIIKSLGKQNLTKIALITKNLTLLKIEPQSPEIISPFSTLLSNLIEIIILVIEGYYQSNIGCVSDDILIASGISTSSKSSQNSEINSQSSADSFQK